MTNEEIINQGMAAIRGQMVNNEMKRLIKEYLGWHPTELRMASAKHFVESGNVSGSLYIAVQAIAFGLVKFFQEQPLLNKEQNVQVSDTRDGASSTQS
ncbi:MAG TPA: hypothetical protein VD794_05470 [Flavisolibacter sp.]|nr:hypothetical protein [Flavisolibacter sp.]